MPRPTNRGHLWPGAYLMGGDPNAPEGAPPPVDCCTVDPGDIPDRADGDGTGHAFQPGEGLGTLEDLNLAHGTVTSDTTGGANGAPTDPTNTNDGNDGTFSESSSYVSPGTGTAIWRWISDLGDEYFVTELTARDYNSGAFNQGWYSTGSVTLQGSHNGSSWSSDLPYTYSTTASGSGTIHHYLLDTPVAYRYWRMIATLAVTTFAFVEGRRLTRWEINGQEIVSEGVWVPAPNVNDSDDATYEEIDGADVLQLDLGAPYRIVRTRLRIGTETAGARTYTIKAATLPDFSDEALIATLDFTATGSFTAQDIEQTWYTADSYQFWHLEGDDELRRIYSWELYEPTLATSHQHDASGIVYDNGTSGLSGDTVQEAIDELDAAVDALGTPDLDDLGDVTITTPVSGQRLRYNGSLWVNSSLRWEPHVDYTGSVVLDGAGNPVMVEVS